LSEVVVFSDGPPAPQQAHKRTAETQHANAALQREMAELADEAKTRERDLETAR
jgi:hypothetical protein